MIVDSVVHIWAANSPQRPWKEGAQPQRAVPLGADELLREMDEAGVDPVDEFERPREVLRPDHGRKTVIRVVGFP